MNPSPRSDAWASGDAYEPYVGRWSRLVAQEFLEWLMIPPGSTWLDVGCGTGALSHMILQHAAPREVKGLDRSADYVHYVRSQIAGQHARFAVGDAEALPVETSTYDATVSGLVLNFIPQPRLAVNEMVRVTRSDGVVALYVWDYAGKMQLMRHFWNAVTALDPAASERDEGRRFPICQPTPLKELFQHAGLSNVVVRSIDISTDFRDFADYWSPFLGGQGPAPGYAMSLSAERQAALRDRIRNALPFALDGSIPLVARAWAVRGVKV
ncbi:Demethylmenaquinone methyltransferase [Thermoflexales bacterium]|nr:Demethylmenaquinone methyltransferase [Thermoflexales bacterium]